MKRATSYEEYLAAIESIKKQDKTTWFSAGEKALTADEQKLDSYMKKKRDALLGGKKYIYDAYSPALMFHKAKTDIMNNDLFDIFKRMPQGGNLHIHTGAAWNTEKFTEMLASNPNVYVYWDPDNAFQRTIPDGKLFLFSTRPDNPHCYNYQQIARLNSKIFIESKKRLTFIDPRVDDIEYIWDGFNDYFTSVSSILKVRSIYKDYYVAAFKYQYQNGNDYIEIRAGISALKENNDDEQPRNDELTGTPAKPMIYSATPPECLTLLKEAYLTAKREGCPDLKVKAIVAPSRRASNKPTEDIANAVAILKQTPAWQQALKDDDGSEFIVGFDLVSEEDINHKTNDYAKEIIKANSKVDFFFHDGESNWVDNDNIHSAWALGTRRIGHGINLYNFPTLLKKIREEDICLEICPISNQMLRYTKDLRIHPVAQFMQQGVQCAICSDDPQIFETAGIYYDLWEVYHGAMIDLRDIKKLIKNSYIYSAMSPREKAVKLAAWEVKWQKYIRDMQPLIG